MFRNSQFTLGMTIVGEKREMSGGRVGDDCRKERNPISDSDRIENERGREGQRERSGDRVK